ncbi:hypothetical protein Pla22_47420 [Rubripirellula amarantea]|uniref:DUF4279 domain-containing protein n=1 Tax=Rubripirellula amarantea TaxID=2527999 RepID=A0A5C5WHI3_9BACT|nr:DUF4279 domain-containing protein [Rubripirellula amarantea]TWT49545.1 hypothetical protein Pla22_47420 [Rubripirellula amarantea]
MHRPLRSGRCRKNLPLGDLPITEYNDEYPTCERTYATLRIYADTLSPEEITSLLGVEPTKSQPAESRPKGVRDVPAGWFLSSDGILDSCDVRRHIDWLINKLLDSHDGLKTIRASGGRADISCFWVSAGGHGGPSIWPHQMSSLGSLGLELWFDVYLGGE